MQSIHLLEIFLCQYNCDHVTLLYRTYVVVADFRISYHYSLSLSLNCFTVSNTGILLHNSAHMLFVIVGLRTTPATELISASEGGGGMNRMTHLASKMCFCSQLPFIEL